MLGILAVASLNQRIDTEMGFFSPHSSNNNYVNLLTFRHLLQGNRLNHARIEALVNALDSANARPGSSSNASPSQAPIFLSLLMQNDYFRTAIEKRREATQLFLRGQEAHPPKEPTRLFQWTVTRSDIHLCFKPTPHGTWVLERSASSLASADEILNKVMYGVVRRIKNESSFLNLVVYREIAKDEDELFTEEERIKLRAFEAKGRIDGSQDKLAIDSFEGDRGFYLEIVRKWLGLGFNEEANTIFISDQYHFKMMVHAIGGQVITDATVAQPKVRSASAGQSPSRPPSSTSPVQPVLPRPASAISPAQAVVVLTAAASTAGMRLDSGVDPGEVVSGPAATKRLASPPPPASQIFPESLIGVGDLNRLGIYRGVATEIITFTQSLRGFLRTTEGSGTVAYEKRIAATTLLLQYVRQYESLLKTLLTTAQGPDNQAWVDRIFSCIFHVFMAASAVRKLTVPVEVEPSMQATYQYARKFVMYRATHMHYFMYESDILALVGDIPVTQVIRRTRTDMASNEILGAQQMHDLLHKVQVFKGMAESLCQRLRQMGRDILASPNPNPLKIILEMLERLMIKLDEVGDNVIPNVSKTHDLMKDIIITSGAICMLSERHYDLGREELTNITLIVSSNMAGLLGMCYDTAVNSFIDKLAAAPVAAAAAPGPASGGPT